MFNGTTLLSKKAKNKILSLSIILPLPTVTIFPLAKAALTNYWV